MIDDIHLQGTQAAGDSLSEEQIIIGSHKTHADSEITFSLDEKQVKMNKLFKAVTSVF